MKNKNDCKIIQDLLPNYVEQLTSDETNIFVENHLKECNECTSVLENMKKDFEKESDNAKKEINYAKKYNARLKILIAVMYTIIFLILAFFGRNFIILKSLTNKMSEYLNATNCYLKIYHYQGWASNTMEFFEKDGDMHVKADNITGTISKNGMLYQIDGEGYTVLEDKGYQSVALGYIEMIKNELNNPKSIFKYSIKEAVVNGKECYQLMNKNTIIYLEKETGLLVRHEELEGIRNMDKNEIQSTLWDYKFEFDCVTDEDFEFDISKLKQL